MAQKLMRPAPPCQAATGPELLRMPTLSASEDTSTLPAAQAAFLARYGLDAARARLTAELAGWRL